MSERPEYKCDYCGTEFYHAFHNDEKIDCPSCGAPVTKVIQHIVQTPNPDGTQTVDITTEPEIVTTIFLVIAVFIAVYFAFLVVPNVLVNIAKQALVNPNPAAISLFQTVLPPTFVGVIFIVFLSVLIPTWKSVEEKEETITTGVPNTQ